MNYLLPLWWPHFAVMVLVVRLQSSLRKFLLSTNLLLIAQNSVTSIFISPSNTVFFFSFLSLFAFIFFFYCFSIILLFFFPFFSLISSFAFLSFLAFLFCICLLIWFTPHPLFYAFLSSYSCLSYFSSLFLFTILLLQTTLLFCICLSSFSSLSCFSSLYLFTILIHFNFFLLWLSFFLFLLVLLLFNVSVFYSDSLHIPFSAAFFLLFIACPASIFCTCFLFSFSY